MPRIRVAPARGNDTAALLVLTKWASRHVKKNGQKRATSPSTLVKNTHARQIAARERIFDRHLPFSWLRFCIGMISLVLVFSDVPRSGTGISNPNGSYPSLQPDEMLAFGTAWNYSVFASTKADSDSGRTAARVWSYKFDSTSIVWRAFGSFLAVPNFPQCFFYTSQCPNKTFGGNVAFKMIDSVVNTVAAVRNNSHEAPVGLTLRSESEYIDRFHQFLLPRWFTSINWRMSQALYYSPELLGKMQVNSICFPGQHNAQIPRFCHELWINFQRTAAPTDLKRRSVGLLYVHTMQRLLDVQTRFSNCSIDLTFLESQEDLQISRGGLSSVGYRRSDVSTIIRARDCNTSDSYDTCQTVYVSDYRYEAGFLVSDVVEWYQLIATLRIVGQIYFILRGVGLLLSCYFGQDISKSDSNLLNWTRVRKAWRLFMRVPKQCVVYGSPFPVLCYALAHLLDASFIYEVFKSRYSTQDGILNIQLQSFISYAVVQMRTVWVYAFIWQLIVTLSTSSWSSRNNLKTCSGIIGVPAFFLSTLSSMTLAAQYRSTSFRSSNIVRVMELPSNLGRAWQAARYQYNFAHRGRGNLLFGGVLIDLKFLVCFVIAIVVIREIVLNYWSLKRKSAKLQTLHWFLLTPTPVPYSAGVMWPSASVCVYWLRIYFCIQSKQQQRLNKLKVEGNFPVRFQLPRYSRFDRVVVPIASSFHSRRPLTEERETLNTTRGWSVQKRVNSRRFIQHHLQCVHRRSDAVEATVAFMNIVFLSDPLVYLSILVDTSRSTELAYYQSRWRPQQAVLLPVDVVGEHNEYTSSLKLLRRVNASELTWSELVQCG